MRYAGRTKVNRYYKEASKMKIASFDIDGVIFMEDYPGVYPGKNDVIITGRSFEELDETVQMLQEKGIKKIPFFNPIKFKEKTRVNSGIHKGKTIKRLNEIGYNIVVHFEDDKIQATQIRKIVPQVKIVMLQHNLTEKENKRYL